MTRVLHVGKYYPPHFGGMETVLKDLVEELRSQVQLEVVVANDRRIEQQEELGFGASLRRLGTVLTALSQPVTPGLKGVLEHAECDIVDIHEPNPWAMACYLASGSRARLVVHYHSDIVKQKWLGAAYLPLLRAALKRASAIVVGSQELIDSSPVLREFRSKCVVVPLGIDLSPFLAIERTPHSGRTPLILAVGRLSYYKGFEYLIRAMVHVPARLVIVGEGRLRGELEALIDSLGLAGRVWLAGRVNDDQLLEYYRQADIFSLPSCERSEAFGLVMVEAMASGLPVVSTDLPTGVRFVNRHGESGLVVPPKDPTSLAAALNELLQDPEERLRLGAAARRRALRHFSRQAMAQGVMEVYTAALDGALPEAVPCTH